MSYALAAAGLAIIAIVTGLGFIRVDEATYMQWRFVFSVGGGLSLGVGIMLIVFGIAVFRDT